MSASTGIHALGMVYEPNTFYRPISKKSKYTKKPFNFLNTAVSYNPPQKNITVMQGQIKWNDASKAQLQHQLTCNGAPLLKNSKAYKAVVNELYIDSGVPSHVVIDSIRKAKDEIVNEHGAMNKQRVTSSIEMPSKFIIKSVNKNGDTKEYLSPEFFLEFFTQDKVRYLGTSIDTGAGKSTASNKALVDLVRKIAKAQGKDKSHSVGVDIRTVNARITNTKAYQVDDYAVDLHMKNQYDDQGKTRHLKRKDYAGMDIRAACTVNNLATLNTDEMWSKDSKVRVLILDEIGTTEQQLHGDACDNFHDASNRLQKMVASATHVLLLDATLTNGNFQGFKQFFMPKDTQDSEIEFYHFDLQRWKKQGVKVDWIENKFAYFHYFKSKMSKLLAVKMAGKEVGIIHYFNRREALLDFTDDLSKQLKQHKKDSTVVYNNLVDDKIIAVARREKLKFRFATYTRPRNRKDKASIVIYQYDYSKASNKAETIIRENDRGGLTTDAFLANPSKCLDDCGIDLFIHSPVLEAGLSFDKSKRFTLTIGYLEPSLNVSGYEGAYQAYGRARDADTWAVYAVPYKIPKSKKGMLLEFPELPTIEELTNKLIENNDSMRKLFCDDKLLQTVKDNRPLSEQLAYFIHEGCIGQNIYMPLFYEAIERAVGSENILLVTKTKWSLVPPVEDIQKEVRDIIKHMAIHELYTKEEMKEIEINRKDNHGLCTLPWFDSIVWKASRLLMSVGGSNVIGNLLPIPIELANGESDNTPNWVDLNNEKRYDIMYVAYELQGTKYKLERAEVLTDKANQEKFKKATVNSSIFEGFLSEKQLDFKPTLKDISSKVKSALRDATVLAYLKEATGTTKLNGLLASSELSKIVIDRDTAIKILGTPKNRKEEMDGRFNPLKTIGNALKAMGLVATTARFGDENETKITSVDLSKGILVVKALQQKYSEANNISIDDCPFNPNDESLGIALSKNVVRAKSAGFEASSFEQKRIDKGADKYDKLLRDFLIDCQPK